MGPLGFVTFLERSRDTNFIEINPDPRIGPEIGFPVNFTLFSLLIENHQPLALELHHISEKGEFGSELGFSN